MKRPVSFAPVLVVVAGMVFAPIAASAGSLYTNKTVNNGLISVGIALEIGKKCSSISPRTLRGLSYLNSLKRHARAQGFTNAQIDAYVDDKAQKKKLEGQARAWLKRRGAKSEAGYCRVGRDEIAKGSPVGTLLRAN